MKTISENLVLNQNFHTSVNLYLDYQNSQKANSFIKTAANVKVLETLQNSLAPNSQNHANILVGPYGKGKSHLVLHFIHQNPDYIPVIINGNSDELELQFFHSLEITQESLGLNLVEGSDLIPDLKTSTKSRTSENYVITAYNQAVKNAKNHGYKGIIVIFDEFSKFLETTEKLNTKFLQDFAETANRSSSLNLLLITHKALSSYSGDSSKGNELAKVEGRFQEIGLHNNFDTSYELIAYAFTVKKYKINLQISDILKNAFINYDENQLNILYSSLYPLHPLTAFILPRISELVAQNERTTFTFLCSTQKNTLSDFSKNHKLGELLTPDVLFDYYEEQLRKASQNSDIYLQYERVLKIRDLFNDDDLQLKIIKTIALIYIIGYFNYLPPTYDILKEIYCAKIIENSEIDSEKTSELKTAEFENALQSLLNENCVIYESHNNGYLSLRETSGIKIPDEIETIKNRIINKFSPLDEINSIVKNIPIYPVRYNDKNDITRYFTVKFSDKISKDFEIKKNDDISKQISSDGLVVLKYQSEIDEELLMNSTIKTLISRAQEDSIYKNELEFIKDDYMCTINSYINSKLKSQNFSELTSLKCEKWFSNYFHYNFELINRNILTSASLKARDEVIKIILDISDGFFELNSTKESDFVDKNSPSNWTMQEKMIFWTFKNAVNKDKQFQKVKDLITKHKKEYIWFNDVYLNLVGYQEKIGLRRGVIPLCLAQCFREIMTDENPQTIIIKEIKSVNSEGTFGFIKELPFCSETLSLVNNNPSRYVYSIIQNKARSSVLDQLWGDFEDYLTNRNEIKSAHNLAQAVNRYYYSLSNLTITSHPEFQLLFDTISKQIHHPTDFFNSELNVIEQKIGQTFGEIKNQLDMHLNKQFTVFAQTFGVEISEVEAMVKSKTNLKLKDLSQQQFEKLLKEKDDYKKVETSNKTYQQPEFTGRVRLLNNEIVNALKEIGSAVTQEEKESVLLNALNIVRNEVF